MLSCVSGTFSQAGETPDAHFDAPIGTDENTLTAAWVW